MTIFRSERDELTKEPRKLHTCGMRKPEVHYQTQLSVLLLEGEAP